MFVSLRAMLSFFVFSTLIFSSATQAELKFVDLELVDEQLVEELLVGEGKANEYDITFSISSDKNGNTDYIVMGNIIFPNNMGVNYAHTEASSSSVQLNTSIDTRSDLIGVFAQFEQPISIALEYEEWGKRKKLETQSVRGIFTLGDDISISLAPERRRILLYRPTQVAQYFSDGLGLTLQFKLLEKSSIYANYHTWDYDFDTQRLQTIVVRRLLYLRYAQRREFLKRLSMASSFSTKTISAGISYLLSWADLNYDWIRSDSILNNVISFSNVLTISKQWNDNWLTNLSINHSSDDTSGETTNYYGFSVAYYF